jgi:two-component system sensor histidine kinase EvgS
MRHRARLRMLLLAVMPAWPADSGFAATTPDFTTEERQWIAAHPLVRFAADTRLAPIEMEERGEYRGIAAEFLQAVARQSGLRFHYVPSANWHAAVQSLLDGHVDMTPNISPMRVSDEARRQLSLTSPYFFSPTLVVTQSDKPVIANLGSFEGKTLAIRAGGAYERNLRTHHPDIHLLPVTLPDEGLTAVLTGVADAAVGTEAVLAPALRRKYAGKLGVAGTIGTMPYMSHMAVRSDAPLLLSIIQKSLDSLSAEETDIMLERVLDRADYGAPTLTSIIRYRAPQLTLTGALIVLLGAFAGCARFAHQRAKRDDRAKSRFMAVMSHEIRTPMNAVLASIEILGRSPLNERQRRLAATALSASESLLALLDNVLDLSRLDASHLDLEPIPTDVVALAMGVTDIVHVAAQAKSLAVDTSFDGIEGNDFVVDPTRLRQVLLNLMSNAVKFTAVGGIALEIRFIAHDDSGGMLCARVTDTGIGIARGQQAHLFLAYAQADNSTTRRYGGTGLGLAICKELVERMGGHITLESSPGTGTQVAFSIPASRVPRAGHGSTRPASDVPSFLAMSGSLLIVEDHPDNRHIIGEQMRDLGVDATIVADGAAALAELDRRSYGLILMDCHMPGMDGYETTRRIREREFAAGHERCPVIAISAATGTDHLGLCIESGMDGVLRKPLRLGDLQGILRAWLGRPEQALDVGHMASESTDTTSLYRRAFLDDARALREALLRHDHDIARYRAHRLKGAATMANCFPLAHHAEHLDQLILSESIESREAEIFGTLARIDIEIARL